VLARLGSLGIAAGQAGAGAIRFVGELTLALGRLLGGHARLRGIDVLAEVQAAGAQSLPIVAVVSVLLGMILAFVGTITLRQFGATVYVANVVTIAMVRELGPVMTAIVMSGRTGSAYAAQLGAMKVTQEIDALETLGLPPIEFLVVPRVVALSLMLPLLTVFADFIGLAGGAVVAVASGSSAAEFERQLRQAIGLQTFWIGLGKCAVFGVVVAVCGCLQGLRAQRSAQAVGEAATAAVVTAIVWIIAIDGLFAVILYVLKL
jgi:phospholipid/cholesterol/gamma-HCH transport system permease protein